MICTSIASLHLTVFQKEADFRISFSWVIVHAVCLLRFIFFPSVSFWLFSLNFIFCFIIQSLTYHVILLYFYTVSFDCSQQLCVSGKLCSSTFIVDSENIKHDISMRKQLASFLCYESWLCIHTRHFQVSKWLYIH